MQLAGRFPGLTVAIAGRGRDTERLAGRVAETGAPVRLLGGVSDEDLPRLVGSADVFAMLCRNRWLGLEQEGFGIVFLEAAAAGVAQVAGGSGGAGEAVENGETGVVVRRPTDAGDVARAIGGLLADQGLRPGWDWPPAGGLRHPSTTTCSHLGWRGPSATGEADVMRAAADDSRRRADRGGTSH